MRKPYEVIKSALQTEKGTMIRPQNKYFFWVDKNANKLEIKNAIESIYNVRVEKVNTEMARGKNKRVRYVTGKTPDWKKAIVGLKSGDKIDIA